jgi:hypothetical protein
LILLFALLPNSEATQSWANSVIAAAFRRQIAVEIARNLDRCRLLPETLAAEPPYADLTILEHKVVSLKAERIARHVESE